MTAYTFANGLRSPPWRQVHGDLAYIAAKPRDGDLITIMANINGYWAIKGTDGDEMNYDRIGDVYSTLVDLLRAKSTHFAENIDKQVKGNEFSGPLELTWRTDFCLQGRAREEGGCHIFSQLGYIHQQAANHPARQSDACNQEEVKQQHSVCVVIELLYT